MNRVTSRLMFRRYKKKLVFITISLFLGFILAVSFLQMNRARVARQLETQKSQSTNIIQTNDLQTSTNERELAKAKNTITQTPPVTARTVYFGTWTEGFWDDTTKQLHPERLTALQNTIGKKVAIAHYYRGWEFLDSEAFLNELNTISSYGWRPMVSANPYYFNRCIIEGKTLYKMIAEGHCDNFLHAVGKNLKQYNRPVFLRFAWEMNIDSIEWGVQRTGDSPENYIAAWRRFHTIVAEEGASNVIWVFSPNAETGTSTPYNQLYPGDQYVDWLGLDGYNWGNTQAWSSWQSFNQVYGSSYQKIAVISPSKPIMIAEVNSTDQGGDKASWYTDMLSVQIPINFPRIKAIVLYNENRSAKENVNWLVDSNPQASKAFREAINSPSYLSSF